ncbi:hypothetical protein CPC16_011922, partial [Podila verticillata]
MCPTPFYRFLALRPSFCVTYPGENDICAQTNTCTCNGNKPACSLQFQPACNRKVKTEGGLVETVNMTHQVAVSCPGMKLEACREGCGAGQMQQLQLHGRRIDVWVELPVD